MGGTVDWAAIPILIEMYGIEDVELFIAEINAIREHKRLIKDLSNG